MSERVEAIMDLVRFMTMEEFRAMMDKVWRDKKKINELTDAEFSEILEAINNYLGTNDATKYYHRSELGSGTQKSWIKRRVQARRSDRGSYH